MIKGWGGPDVNLSGCGVRYDVGLFAASDGADIEC